jgi:hypothetical protein
MIFYVIKKYGKKLMEKITSKFMPKMGGGNDFKQSMDILSQMFKNPNKR